MQIIWKTCNEIFVSKKYDYQFLHGLLRSDIFRFRRSNQFFYYIYFGLMSKNVWYFSFYFNRYISNRSYFFHWYFQNKSTRQLYLKNVVHWMRYLNIFYLKWRWNSELQHWKFPFILHQFYCLPEMQNSLFFRLNT